jgi:tetratricopeptide (TPR) repeat protein
MPHKKILIVLMLFFITNSFGKSINKYIDLLKKEDSLNNTEKALTYAHMSFEIIKKQKKVSVGDIANANTIGNFYFRNKQYNNAIVVYEFICKKNIREYGENNINYTSCLFSLTRSYEKSGDIFNTDSLYKKLLEIYKITLKKDDAEYLYTLDDYARFNFELGRYENAEKLFNECLSGYKTIFGSKSKRYGWTLNNLGNVYVKKKPISRGREILFVLSVVI